MLCGYIYLQVQYKVPSYFIVYMCIYIKIHKFFLKSIIILLGHGSWAKFWSQQYANWVLNFHTGLWVKEFCPDNVSAWGLRDPKVPRGLTVPLLLV